MSYILKAFLQIGSFQNNAVNATAMFGELSNLAYTYAIEKGKYFDNAYPGLTLVSFSSKVNGVTAVLPAGYPVHTLEVGKWMLDKALSAGATQIQRADLLAQIIDDLGTDLTDVDCGLITYDGTRWLPEWISWRALGLTQTDNRITLYFKDAAFRGQFDETAVTVVAPLVNLNNFFLGSAQVLAQINAITADTLSQRINDAKNGNPESFFRQVTYQYNDPLNAANKIACTFTFLIYGISGDNPDDINYAAAQYLLSHSTHTQAEWEVIFPDIFKRTEYLVLPNWYNQAIEYQSNVAGIYSAIFDINTDGGLLKTWATAQFPEYTTLQVNRATQNFTHNYRCVSLTFIGNIKNRESKWKLSDWYPDYIPVSSTSVDFSRMSSDTAVWATALNEAIYFAETWTPVTPLIPGIRKVTRNEIEFLVFTHNNINFLVYPKFNTPYADY